MDRSDDREAFVDEIAKNIYKDLPFSDQEKTASARFQKLVEAAKDEKAGIKEDFHFSLAMRYKKEMEATELFQKLKQMPKGALLHHHLVSEIDPEWLVKKTYQENVYQRYVKRVRTASSNVLVFTKKPKEDDKLVIGLRKDFGNPEEYDDSLRKTLSLQPQEFDAALNNYEIWRKFIYTKYFFGNSLVSYTEFFKEHLKLLCEKYIAEGVYRFETRHCPGFLRDENEEPVSIDKEAQIIIEVIDEVKKTHPHFSFGIICEVYRSLTSEEFKKRTHNAYYLKSLAPEIVVGLDFDGDEDNFKRLKELAPLIKEVTKECEEKYKCTLPLILHCGESIIYSNENIIDALILNVKRIGHGINIIKYPLLMSELKKRDICIEINPISNQTLKLVRDLRMHPAATYLNNGMPIAISGDDPTTYNTSGVTYDFFVAVLSYEWTLKDLKLVCLNSIRYSETDTTEKKKMEELFLKNWQTFIESL